MASSTCLIFKNTTARDMSIEKADIEGCVLHNITVSGSIIQNSTLTKCTVIECEISRSKFIKCKIQCNEIQHCQFEESDIRPSPATFRKIPPEIRKLIFFEVLSSDWNGKTPSLLVALRGDAELYAEALEVFRKTNVFKITSRSGIDMAESVITSIKSLEIRFGDCGLSSQIAKFKETFASPACYQKVQISFIGIHWSILAVCGADISLVGTGIPYVLAASPFVKSLGLSFHSNKIPNSDRHVPACSRTLEEISKRLGVAHKLLTSLNGDSQSLIVEWKAEEGRSLVLNSGSNWAVAQDK